MRKRREGHSRGSHLEGRGVDGGVWMDRTGLLQGSWCNNNISSLFPDLEKRKNPVCHFVTPLDGSVDVDEHRRPEVLGKPSEWAGKGNCPCSQDRLAESWVLRGRLWGRSRVPCCDSSQYELKKA